MAKKIVIINNALVVTDTSDSDKVILDVPKKDFYYDNGLLEDNNQIVFKNLNLGEQDHKGRVSIPLAEAIDTTDTSFTATTFRTFCRANLGA